MRYIDCMMVRFIFFAAAAMLISTLPASTESLQTGVENTYTPSGSGVFNNVRGFVYVPLGSITAGAAVSRADRGDWWQWKTEAAAVWVWGGPLYSEARYGISLDSDSIAAHHGYMDIFYEQASYYLTASLRGQVHPEPDAVVSMGGAYYGWVSNRLNLRLYAASDPVSVSAAAWHTVQVTDKLKLQAGGSLSLADDQDLPLSGSLSAGPGIRIGSRWKLSYQLRQEFPTNRERTTHHQLSLTGSVPLRREE